MHPNNSVIFTAFLAAILTCGCVNSTQTTVQTPDEPGDTRPDVVERGCPEELEFEFVTVFGERTMRFVDGLPEVANFYTETGEFIERQLSVDELRELGLHPDGSTPIWLLGSSENPCRMTDRNYTSMRDFNGAETVYAELDGDCEILENGSLAIRSEEEPTTCRQLVVDMVNESSHDTTPSLPEPIASLTDEQFCEESGCEVYFRLRETDFGQLRIISFSAQEHLETDFGDDYELCSEFGDEMTGTYAAFGPEPEHSFVSISPSDYQYVIFIHDHEGLRALVLSDLLYGYESFVIDQQNPPDQWTHSYGSWSWESTDMSHPDSLFSGCDP